MNYQIHITINLEDAEDIRDKDYLIHNIQRQVYDSLNKFVGNLKHRKSSIEIDVVTEEIIK